MNDRRTEQQRLDSIIRMFEALSRDTSAQGMKYYNTRKSAVIGYLLNTEQWHMLMGILPSKKEWLFSN